ncbi:MAG: aminoacyl-tRNA hydrolase [Propionibacteriaceae bacterium]|nr:aminoacyl-tRNA hydrolase [Propionibacteriaceae bacterium]
MATWLVVGLGNPGSTYAHNRHNIGAMVVQELVKRGSSPLKPRRMLKAETAEVRLGPGGFGVPSNDSQAVVLATTRMYMNLSGIPTRNLLASQKIKPDHLIVIHDELDLDLGQLRVKFGGGDNGHNGLKSIRAQGGTGEYFRVRIGVGRPSGCIDVSKWVLTDFRKDEREQVSDMVTRGADAVESLINEGLDVTQGKFNS